MKQVIIVTVMTCFICSYGNAQVINTSYKTKTGERILQLSVIVPLDKENAWKLFTKDEQLIKWFAPLAHIDLKIGGAIMTNYNKNKSLFDSTSIRLGIINYLENELLTLKVNLNNNFSKQTQDEDDNLQEIIQFVEVAKGQTKITSSMVGWRYGADWDKNYNFFEKGNAWTFQQMLKLFK